MSALGQRQTCLPVMPKPAICRIADAHAEGHDFCLCQCRPRALTTSVPASTFDGLPCGIL